MADSGDKTLDLSFIERDIRNQLAHSRDILSQVEELQKILANTTDQQMKARIGDSIRRLLEIAKSLSSNALSTSNSTTTLVGPMVPKK